MHPVSHAAAEAFLLIVMLTMAIHMQALETSFGCVAGTAC